MEELIKELETGKISPYEYIGGGYFRDKRIPKGKKGDTMHGQQYVDFLLKTIAERLKSTVKVPIKI